VDLWDKYIDPAYRERAPRMIVDTDGKERLLVERQVLAARRASTSSAPSGPGRAGFPRPP